MISFTCNICGTRNALEEIPWEESTCSGCGSNVRMRALMYLLSIELFGAARPVAEFPKDKKIRGFGLSDALLYATPLEEKCDYTNTYYDRQPYLDITQPHPEQYGTYDFILSSDVFEHVAIPVERAFEEAFRLLKPQGVLCITVPSSGADEDTVEYYPNLHEYSIVELGGEHVLVNRKKDRTLEVHQNLEFHGGIGATLVMRQFSQRDMAAKLRGSGFEAGGVSDGIGAGVRNRAGGELESAVGGSQSGAGGGGCAEGNAGVGSAGGGSGDCGGGDGSGGRWGIRNWKIRFRGCTMRRLR